MANFINEWLKQKNTIKKVEIETEKQPKADMPNLKNYKLNTRTQAPPET